MLFWWLWSFNLAFERNQTSPLQNAANHALLSAVRIKHFNPSLINNPFVPLHESPNSNLSIRKQNHFVFAFPKSRKNSPTLQNPAITRRSCKEAHFLSSRLYNLAEYHIASPNNPIRISPERILQQFAVIQLLYSAHKIGLNVGLIFINFQLQSASPSLTNRNHPARS
jgi:hypothetical protein